MRSFRLQGRGPRPAGTTSRPAGGFAPGRAARCSAWNTAVAGPRLLSYPLVAGRPASSLSSLSLRCLRGCFWPACVTWAVSSPSRLRIVVYFFVQHPTPRRTKPLKSCLSCRSVSSRLDSKFERAGVSGLGLRVCSLGVLVEWVSRKRETFPPVSFGPAPARFGFAFGRTVPALSSASPSGSGPL